MWRSFLPVEDKDGIHERMGLSFFELDQGGKRLVGPHRQQRGFRAFIYLEPTSGYGVIGVINTAPADEEAKDAHPAVEKIWSGVRAGSLTNC